MKTSVRESHTAAVATQPSRLLSLDLLRGATIAFMILVNNNGDEPHAYWPLKHADWNGFTPTDLIFPTFLFLVGVSLVLATASRQARGIKQGVILLQAARRTGLLIAFGLLVNSFPFFHLATMRFYGVLQRIAICYFIGTVLLLLTRSWRVIAGVAAAALVSYWLLMRFVPVPGYGIPTQAMPILDHDANLVAWLDRQLFTANHLYEKTRDPEGLLSTLPAIGTVLIGVLTGLWIRTTHTLKRKSTAIAIAGATSVVLGELWNLSFPINKKLWTSSYVLLAAGVSLLLLALSIWIVDIRSKQEKENERGWRPALLMPFLVFGTNAISAYVFSELLAGLIDSITVRPRVSVSRWIFNAIHAVAPSLPFASLLYSLLIVCICWLAVYTLYRRRIFLRV